jgi:N-acyl-D-aspartate/D-glutamate deacylase
MDDPLSPTILRRSACVAALLCSTLPLAAQSPAYDVVIRNGRVLDGRGNPWIAADVGIRAGRIVAIGVVPGTGTREIDAKGLYVSPGWFDMMDQSGSVLPRNGLADNKLRQGVTTALGGEGGTPVPAGKAAEYFRGLEQSGISLNFGSYYGATQARTAIMGPVSRTPTPEELDRMRALVDTAMRAGALGVTTALIYPPSSYHTTDELVELAKVAARYGGLYASHIRGEGKDLLDAVREAIAIGERSGAPVEIFHLKAAYQPGWGTLMKAARLVIDSARARGVDVAADQYPYTAGGTGLEATIPSWAFDGGVDSLRARLKDPAIRARLKREVETGSPGWWNVVEASGGWKNVVLANARNEQNARYVGKNLAEIAKEMHKDPRDAAWDLVLEGQGRVTAIYHMMSEQDVREAIQFPWVSIGSDAGAALEPGKVDVLGLPHPRSYGTFPRVIGKYVRDEHVLSLPDAIRKMTSWPATRMRIADRGAIAVGNWADITIFDLDRIRDVSTYESPVAFPEGIPYVLVNGVVVIDQGRHTGAKPGKVIYGPGREAPAGQ